MHAPKILLISEQQATPPVWNFRVMGQRLQVILERQPARTFQRWVDETPDLLLFDIEPGSDVPLRVIRELREQSVLPILVLSFNPTDQAALEAYESGVDEYILKPIHPLLLQSKVKAWLRRSWSIPVDMLDALTVGQVQFIPAERVIVFDHHNPIHLTNLELRLMFYLLSHAGRVVTAAELCQRVWGNYTEGKKTTLKNIVYRLRMKIEMDPAHPHYIHTVAGVGYRFTPQ